MKANFLLEKFELFHKCLEIFQYEYQNDKNRKLSDRENWYPDQPENSFACIKSFRYDHHYPSYFEQLIEILTDQYWLSVVKKEIIFIENWILLLFYAILNVIWEFEILHR